jgi:hypothetical protein
VPPGSSLIAVLTGEAFAPVRKLKLLASDRMSSSKKARSTRIRMWLPASRRAHVECACASPSAWAARQAPYVVVQKQMGAGNELKASSRRHSVKIGSLFSVFEHAMTVSEVQCFADPAYIST